ncbi:hypothetical protein BHU72_05010 [Desulfuribacillus stibiiarsenatis]|uniref:NADH-quinone oxidoreductase subunit I n=1 Tax=Desulfuribacillus stibiiarsenatis TaxID=1390249 RepID=A0A1E5L5M5_9FIRM|nr:NADH-quinone oxidoreductase subunit I [Desulfuribacillus stibiiarsenatis]OEH85447.1 hypothetical protein BHU72_05010 [Desulfuribacillus stibiiarsenatis]
MLRFLKGFGVTFKYFFKKKVTIQYPEQKPNWPERFRGIHRFFPDKCIVCNLCVKACPTEVITLTGEKDEESGKKKIVTYDIQFERCIQCVYCTEVCPTEAIVMTTRFDNLAVYNRKALLKDRTWLENNHVYGNYKEPDQTAPTESVEPVDKTTDNGAGKGGDAQ